MVMKKNNFILSILIAGLWSAIMFPSGKANFKAALIYPSLTKNVLYRTNPSFNPTEEWELFFLSHNYDYEMFNDDDLDDIDSDVSVVVIPSMEVVSEEMLSELKQLLDEGKGILLTGNFAEYDTRGKKRVSDDFTGFEILKLNSNEQLSVNHYLYGSTPFSSGLKPGQKILLSVSPDLFYAGRLKTDAHPEGSYLLSDSLFPGIVSNSLSKGRLLWFGFSVSQVIDKNQEILLSNSLNWLASQPEAFINYWPGNYASAVIQYKKIERLSDSSQMHLAKPEKLNYFISPYFLEKLPGKLKEIADSSSINPVWDNYLFSKMDPNEKIDWLKKIQSRIKEINGQKYFGIISYGEFIDPQTYKLLAETGYSFIFSSGYSDSFTFDYDTTNNLYLFYRPSYSARVQYTPDLNFSPGGIYYINEDSIGKSDYSQLSKQNCWLTTFSDLIRWEEERKNIEINIDLSERGIYEVNIKNNNASDIQDAGVWISVPHLNTKVVTIDGQERKLTFDTIKNMYFLSLPLTGGYQELSFKIPIND